MASVQRPFLRVPIARFGVLMPGGKGDADGGADQIFPVRPQLSGGIEGFSPAVLLATVRVR